MPLSSLLHAPQRLLAILVACGAPCLAAADEAYSYVHHAVSTGQPAAQEAFDRGLTLVFAYQSAEAEQAFRQAARLDPGLAMAWWGVGLALGPDINVGPDLERTHRAAEALGRATELARQRASTAEREYIAALAARYSAAEHPDFDALAIAYRNAMRSIVAAHAEDADAAALYAEAIMDLRPWQLWSADGAPAPDTTELVQMLEEHLQRSPGHMGLLHFYIHALEASPHPERALAAARRLGQMPMEPAAAHLVHMPAHIYLRVGDWASAIDSNQHAVHHALDYQQSQKPATEHACGHCLDFLRYAYSMAGNLALAREAAGHYQLLTGDPTNTLSILLRFRQWDEVLTTPEPAPAKDSKDPSPHAILGFWHYARGVALAATGRPERADAELAALRAEAAQLPLPRVAPAAALDVEHTLDRLSRAWDIDGLAMAEQVLLARLAQSRGRAPQALEYWRAAVAIQDRTPYSEPPAWYYPLRESLGAALLRAGRAAQAQAVFEEDLRRNPNNPRSLFGLAAACRAAHQSQAARAAEAAFRAAWTRSDRPLALGDL